MVATATVTDYEIPGTVTVTQSFDCHGCQAIVTQNLCGIGPVRSIPSPKLKSCFMYVLLMKGVCL